MPKRVDHRIGDAADRQRRRSPPRTRARTAPGDAQPRSPPCAALPSSELARASCSKVVVPARMSRLNCEQAARRRFAATARPRAAAGCDGRAICCDRERAAVLALDQLQHVKAGAAAQQLGRDLAALERLHRLDEQVGQAVGRPHADLAALGAIAVLGDLARDGREVFAGRGRRRSAASARARAARRRPRRSRPSGTVTRICAMLISAPPPAAARRFSISSSISASLILMRLTTSRSRTRSTSIWSRMLSRNLA